MSKSRRLRNLRPDEALFNRRAAGESLRSLALSYGVHHATLVRFFRRPEATLRLQEAHRLLAVERKGRQVNERRLMRDIQKRAREDQKRDRLLQAWTPPKRLHLSEEMVRLDANDAPRGLTSRQRFSENDHKAAEVVAAGGGAEDLIAATGLRTLENVLRNIDPQLLRAAMANDKARPDNRGLRRLVPDRELVTRRAAGETVRSIAADYDVAHTTLSRYYKRPEVAKQIRAQRRPGRPAA